MERCSNSRRPTEDVLTKSESRVAEGYVSGLIGKEIASKLHLSYNTIIRHTRHIYDKTGIPRSTNSLVAWFLEKNYDLDLSDIRRKFGALILVCILGYQIANTDFSDNFLRSSSRRVEARGARGGRRNRKEDDNSTLNLLSL